MQDITEQQDVAQEISEAISSRAGFADEFDEVSVAIKLKVKEVYSLICWLFHCTISCFYFNPGVPK